MDNRRRKTQNPVEDIESGRKADDERPLGNDGFEEDEERDFVEGEREFDDDRDFDEERAVDDQGEWEEDDRDNENLN